MYDNYDRKSHHYLDKIRRSFSAHPTKTTRPCAFIYLEMTSYNASVQAMLDVGHALSYTDNRTLGYLKSWIDLFNGTHTTDQVSIV